MTSSSMTNTTTAHDRSGGHDRNIIPHDNNTPPRRGHRGAADAFLMCVYACVGYCLSSLLWLESGTRDENRVHLRGLKARIGCAPGRHAPRVGCGVGILSLVC